MARQRLIWVDALKGWLMLLVVLGHAIQTELGAECNNSHIWNLIYSFHMPAFMAVSGWLFYQKPQQIPMDIQSYSKSLTSIFVRRSYQLIIPFFIWSLLVFLLRGTYTIEKFVNIIYKPDEYFWFLWVLFGITVIFSSVQTLSKKLNLSEMMIICLSCFVLFGIMVIIDLRIFGFQFLAYYFIFYSLGYILHKYELCLSHLNRPWIFFVLFCVWLFLAWHWKMHELPSWMPSILYIPESVQQYLYRGITALLAVLILLFTAPNIMNGQNKFNRFICLIGDISLGIYVVHSLIMEYIKVGIHSLSAHPYVNIVIIFIITFIFSLLLVFLLRKNKYTARFFLGKDSNGEHQTLSSSRS